jgi:hypothetical protein
VDSWVVPAAKKNMLDLSSCFSFVLASGWMEMDSDRWSAVEGWVADCAALRRRTKMSLFAVSELSSMQPCSETMFNLHWSNSLYS